ncbi:MAG: hypothetical protein AXA67_09910 [Methylothermaceae bacteria B42]|nr:MAG: hypothetical protein AXA67_09910 [Methylothermaceae bacteria B42]HHJ39618.1 penicillin-binding protein activator [Methylothermaceae bacterium]
MEIPESPRLMINMLTRGCFLFFLVFMASCAPLQPQPSPLPSPTIDWERHARALSRAGKHTQAAMKYQQGAETITGAQRQRYLLYAAQELLKAGDTQAATRLLAKIRPDQLPPQDQIPHALLAAQLALDSGEPGEALSILERIHPNQLPKPQRIHYHKIRAASFAILGNLKNSLQERLTLSQLLRTAQEIEENNQAILEALLLLSPDELEQIQTIPHRDMPGWVALARIISRYSSLSPELERALYRWRLAYPDHPAKYRRFLEHFLAQRQRSFQPPQQIAVLLPQSGPFQNAAEAIKTGIATAQNLPSNSYFPALSYYDSESADPVSLYQQASQEGAELILGPLQKSNVEQLGQITKLNPPVLSLNRIENLYRSGLYQFSLSPEEEARQVANSAWLHNHQRALILVPDTAFGQRIGEYFASYWQTLGGTVLEIQYFDNTVSDFSKPIERLLNIDESRQRFRSLKRVIGNAVMETRIRRDADFLFLVANPKQGRLIRPQLLFYRAEYLPVYATSSIYGGHRNPRWDKDLEGVRFCDIPWLLGGEYQNAPSLQAFEAEQGRFPGPYLRLVALGIDAYHLPFTLLVNGQRYPGTTGALTLRDDGHIARQLTCAEFKNGVPVIYGMAPDIVIDVPEEE